MHYSSPGSSVHGISQARILDWVAISVSRDFPDPGIKPESPPLAGGFFTTEAPGKPKAIILPMGGKKKKKERKEKNGGKGRQQLSFLSLNQCFLGFFERGDDHCVRC